MADVLDVMLLESHPHAADHAAAALEAAGHRVHRCHEPGERAFPCTGVTDPAACPISRGADVALLVRQRITPRPTPIEDGVSCALRAGVPLVEDGPDILYPFEPWLAARSVGNVVDACAEAAQRTLEPLRRDIVRRTATLLHGAGIDPASIDCRIERNSPRMHVRLAGPAVSAKLTQALAVRVLDAVRASGRTYGQVDFSYQPTRDEESADAC